MSQPKRYNMAWTAKVLDPEQGAWVEWDDYAALAAENERLRQHRYTPQEIESIRADIDKLHTEFNRNLFKKVCAENNRLRKAGEEILDMLYEWDGEHECYWARASRIWDAAKEGEDAK